MGRTLSKACGLGLVVVLIAAFIIQVCAQKNSPSPSEAPLLLTGTIPHIGQVQAAVRALRNAADRGFLCSPNTLNSDPWFASVRKYPRFTSLRDAIERQVKTARLEFEK